jgi:hypothetical protein
MEKAIVKISIVPAPKELILKGDGNNIDNKKKEKRIKPRIKFDLNGFSAYLPSNVGGGGGLVDEPTMFIKVI